MIVLLCDLPPAPARFAKRIGGQVCALRVCGSSFGIKMIRFDECEICAGIPRTVFEFLTTEQGQTTGRDGGYPIPAEAQELACVDRAFYLYKCPRCGAYYQHDILDRGWPSGSLQNYLYRLTPTKARARLKYARAETPAGQERLWLEEHYPALIQSAGQGLAGAQAHAREYAAETLADHFKVAHNWDAVVQVIGHADSRVRYGGLLAFTRLSFYAIDVPYTCIIPQLVAAVCDVDAGVRGLAAGLLSDLHKQKKNILQKLRKIPAVQQSVECRCLRLELTDSIPELVDGLANGDAAVRGRALARLYEHSYYFSSDVPGIKAEIRKRDPASVTSEMQEYLGEGLPWLKAFGEDDD